jgi:arylsulfatase A-like enzyme
MKADHSQPNFLFFVVDQMQSFCLGCNGNKEIQTPSINELAADGISFRRAYCNNHVCMPSRATMITGLTPRQHGCITNGTILPQNIPTITNALTEIGYHTHAIGKIHLQPFGASDETHDNGTPLSWESRAAWDSGRIHGLPQPYYGFASSDFVGGHVHYSFGDYATWLASVEPKAHRLYQQENAYYCRPQTPWSWRLSIPEELHYNTWIADKAISFLDSTGTKKPFFLWCSFPDPHFPFSACRPYSEMYDPGSITCAATVDKPEDMCTYLTELRKNRPMYSAFDTPALGEITTQTYGMITHVDTCIGRIIQHLKESGFYDTTVIVFLSDHGEYLGTHHLLYKGPWPYEELVRVPFIWKGITNRINTNARDAVVSMLDLAPTVLDYAGISQAAFDIRRTGQDTFPGLPGRSLKPAIEAGEALRPRPALIEYDEDCFPGSMCRLRTIVTDEYKLSVYPPYEDGILFSHSDDPYETRNLWHEPSCRETRALLMQQLVNICAGTDRLDLQRISDA